MNGRKVLLGILLSLCGFSNLIGLDKPVVKSKDVIPSKEAAVLKELMAHQKPYAYPGIVVLKNGAWEGSDYIYNLTNKIGVAVDIAQPANVSIGLSDVKLKGIVEEAFRKGGITPIAEGTDDVPFLPFFQIEIFIYPIDKGYAVTCQGKLFESVKVKRVVLEKGAAIQAITWEKETLMVISTDNADIQIEKRVEELADAFVKLFQLYETLKKPQQPYSDSLRLGFG